MRRMKFVRAAAICFILMVGGGITCGSSANAEYPKPQLISSKAKLSLQQVTQSIKTQGRKSEYYLKELTFKEVQLDTDKELEVIASSIGGSHLGSFFIFDRNGNKLKLIAEKEWHVDSLEMRLPVTVGEKIIFETVENTGGSGLDVKIAHLWYLQKGKWIEAWNGKLQEMNAMVSGAYSKVAGGYQLLDSDNTLYAWETLIKLADDGTTEIGKPETTLTMYSFDGNKFVKKQ